MRILIFVLISFSCCNAISSEIPMKREFVKGLHEASFTHGVCVFFNGMWEKAVVNKNQLAKEFLHGYLKEKLMVEDYEEWVRYCTKQIIIMQGVSDMYDLNIKLSKDGE